MVLIVSDKDILDFVRPTKCALRVNLRKAGAAEAEPDAYEAVQDELTAAVLENEKSRLNAVDCSRTLLNERFACSKETTDTVLPALYRPLLETTSVIGEKTCTMQGSPDFLIADNQARGERIRVCDSSMLVSDKEPALAHLRLQYYAHIYETSYGAKPVALEIVDGAGKIHAVQQNNKGLSDTLADVVSALAVEQAPYEPVGRSKCLQCTFNKLCWNKAVASDDVALLKGVDQNLARALHEIGVKSTADLYRKYRGKQDELAKLERRWGKKTKAVGMDDARIILLFAEAIVEKRDLLIQPLAVPDVANYVMFDLEGVPDRLDPLAPIYIWGLQVFGENPGKFMPAIAPFGADGDKAGWEAFLARSQEIFAEHGDVPFIHWAKYERARVDAYTARFGDPNGVAARVRRNLVDLQVETEAALVMPIPSYSLKVVEQYIGYQRTQEEFGTNWSIQQYMEALASNDEAVRQKIMSGLLKYNQEDLEATWATLCWAKKRARELGAASTSPAA